jgi:manganese-dependent ADP-ribose/CDP-alcohol diphosphatase
MRKIHIILFSLMSFTLQAQNVRFGVIADTQYCNCENAPRYNRFFAETKSRLAEAKDTFNNTRLDFVISLGDMIDRDWASFDEILPIFDSISGPRYHVLGNHDFFVEDSLKYLVPQRLGLNRRYYHFEQNNWRFIVLDANDLSVQAYPKGTAEYQRSLALLHQLQEEEAIQAKDWNGAIGKDQQQWLIRQLEEATASNQQVIIFSHMPVMPLNMNTLWNHLEILRITDRFDCVKAFFSGHYHEGNYVSLNGVHHYNFKGMLNTPADNAFAIVEVDEDKITIKGFGRETDTTLVIE